MDSLECSVHFLTLMQTGYDELNAAVTFYHDRTHFDEKQRNLYAVFAEDFHLNQGRHFVLHNRKATVPSKMSRLKDQVRELDALFAGYADSSGDDEAKAKASAAAAAASTDRPASKWSFVKTGKASTAANDLLSYFASCLHTHVAKTLWLAPARLLVVLQDGQLVWLVLDPVSGDIVRLLVDKTLSGAFGPKEASRLSGRVLSDLAVMPSITTSAPSKGEPRRPQLVAVYSDQAKVDLIGLNKAAAFYQSLQEPREHKLERLAAFEPVILQTFEFACPNVFRVEKRLCLPAPGSGTFSVWWPNEGQIVWSAESSAALQASEAVSLLERDDLRNNVVVVSAELGAERNLLEYMFKSDGLLLSLSYLNGDERALIAVEQAEIVHPRPKYTVNVYRYNVPVGGSGGGGDEARSMKLKLGSFDLHARIASLEQVKVAGKFVLMLAVDQTLVLFELGRNLAHRHKPQTAVFFSGVEWLVDDLIFCTYDVNGALHAFDVAFNPVRLGYMTRYGTEFRSLSEHLTLKLFQPFDVESKTSVLELAASIARPPVRDSSASASMNARPTPTNRFIGLTSARRTFADSLWCGFHFAKGPFGLFRLALPDGFSCVSLTNHYLKSSQSQASYLNAAVKLLHCLDWDSEAALSLACLSRLMNYVLASRVPFNTETERLAEAALGTFYRPPKPLREQTIYEHKHQLSRYARRFFYKLLARQRLSKAYLLAVDIGAKDLFNDLYYCALDADEYQLAEICRKKYHEIVADERDEKRRSELNRSVTAIDDNISNVESAFDRYSVSSSEAGSAGDSEADEDEDLTDFDQGAAGRRRDLGDVLDALVNRRPLRQPLIQTDARKLPIMVVDKSLETSRQPKTYSEQELEEFARKLYLDNKFIYELNFDNVI